MCVCECVFSSKSTTWWVTTTNAGDKCMRAVTKWEFLKQKQCKIRGSCLSDWLNFYYMYCIKKRKWLRCKIGFFKQSFCLSEMTFSELWWTKFACCAGFKQKPIHIWKQKTFHIFVHYFLIDYEKQKLTEKIFGMAPMPCLYGALLTLKMIVLPNLY